MDCLQHEHARHAVSPGAPLQFDARDFGRRLVRYELEEGIGVAVGVPGFVSGCDICINERLISFLFEAIDKLTSVGAWL